MSEQVKVVKCGSRTRDEVYHSTYCVSLPFACIAFIIKNIFKTRFTKDYRKR